MYEETTNSQMKTLERMQGRAVRVARSPYGLFGLSLISFIESALVVPIITDPFLIGYILAHRKRAVLAVVLTTLASLLGGIAAYIFAVGFFDMTVSYLSSENVELLYQFSGRFEEETFLLTLLGAVTPIPYTLVALAAGFVQGNFLLFVLASLIGRGGRYSLVGYFTYRFGEQSLGLIRKNLTLATVALFVLVAIYAVVHYVLHWI